MHCLLNRKQSQKYNSFLDFIKTQNSFVSPFHGPRQIPYRFIDTSTSEIPTLSYTWSLKKIPFPEKLPRIGHHREPTPLPGAAYTAGAGINIRKLYLLNQTPP